MNGNCGSGCGGVLYANSGAEFVFEDCIFENDISLKGGVYFSDNEDITLVLFEKCKFTNCSANSDGGALAIFHPQNTTITQCIFCDCSTTFGLI
jgi:hypothetical protein